MSEQKYEYKCVLILALAQRTSRILNEYARDGWELIDTWRAHFYFRRAMEAASADS